MRLSTLRRPAPTGPPAIAAVARVDRRTSNLLHRIKPGEIAVVDHLDLDRQAAVALVEAGVAAVVNAAPSISGRYPNLGPQYLVEAGVALVDDVGNGVLTALHDGLYVRVVGDAVYLGDELVATGARQDRASVAAAMAGARDGVPSRLEALSASAVELLRRERDLLLDGVGVPRLATSLGGRQAVVVVREFAYQQDLAALRTFLRERSPVLIGVDAGADALLAAKRRPDLIVCSGDDVSETALRCGAEVVVVCGPDGRAPGLDRVERLGVRHTTFVTGASARDAALLLAASNGAELVVTAGMPPGLAEFLDTGRSSMASWFLTRAAVGARVADATAVAQLYRHRLRAWMLLVLVLVALLAVGAALVTTPVGQDWWDSLRTWLTDTYDSARQAVT